ncbi:MAG: FecR domain-containing protein [Acidobacteria bacterium]|nr:FecR domain-containing protein [Acidobacteriota bacterium]
MSNSALRSSYFRSALRLLFTTVTILIFDSSLLAQSHARIVRLSYVEGDVQIDKSDSHGFNPAFLNMPVLNQSKVWARDGQAEVELDDGSAIRLTPDAIVDFHELSVDADGGRITVLELTQGTAYFNIRYHDNDDFRLEFGHEQVELNKAAHFRVEVDKHEMHLAVLSGEVTVSNGVGFEVAVKKDETIRLNSEDTQHYQLAQGVDVENYDTWDSERASDHDQRTTDAVIWSGNGSTSQSVSSSTSYYYFPSAFSGYSGSCYSQYSAFGSPFYSGWSLWPNSVGYAPVGAYGYGYGCPNYYSNWNGYSYLNGGYVLAPLAPSHFHSPTHPRHGPGEIITANGPGRRFVIDNDVIAQRYHGAAPATAAVPTQGFVPARPTASPIVVGTPTVTSGPNIRPVTPVIPAQHPVHTPTVATAPAPSRGSAPSAASAPRPAPSFGGGPRMSSPSMSSGGMRMSSPSMSSGGAHMGGGSMGRGARSSGGSNHH